MTRENLLGSVDASRERAIDVFAAWYPYLAILGIVVVVVTSIELGVASLARRGFQTVGIPVIVASLVLIAGWHARGDRTTTTRPHVGNPAVARVLRRKRLTVSAYLVLFAVSVWLLTVGPRRPWTYFVVVALIYALVVLQILVDEFDPRIVLAEVPLLILNLTYGVTLKYQYYYGWTDVFGHVELAKVTHLTGRTIPESVSLMYTEFPLFHIFVSEAAYLLYLDVKTAMFVVTPIPYAITAIVLYYLLAGNFRDERVPALVTVLYSANTIVLFYGSYMITRTMAYVGFVLLLYVVYKRSREDASAYTFLLAFVGFFIITVHQVSILQILALLLVLYACKRFVRLPKFLPFGTIVLLTGMFVAYWLLFAWDFVMKLVEVYTRPEHYDEVVITSVGSQSTDSPAWVDLVSRIRYLGHNYLVVITAVLGIGVAFYEKHTKYVRTLLLFSLLTLGIFVPSPLRVIGQAMDLFRFDRLELLVSPFVALAMGVGVVSFVSRVNLSRSSAKRRIGTTLAFVLVVTYVFSSVTHPLVASDAEELPWSESRKHLTESEVEGFDFVLREVDPGSPIRSDAHTLRFHDRMAFNDIETTYPRPYRTEPIYNYTNVSDYEGYTVFRSEKFRKSGLELSITGAKLFPTPKTKQVLQRQFHAKNKIFSNGDVEIYYTNEKRDRFADGDDDGNESLNVSLRGCDGTVRDTCTEERRNAPRAP